MKLLAVFILVVVACCDARLQLSKQSYMRFPYQYINGDPTNPRYALFQNAAHKATFHVLDKILYVACKFLSLISNNIYT